MPSRVAPLIRRPVSTPPGASLASTVARVGHGGRGAGSAWLRGGGEIGARAAVVIAVSTLGAGVRCSHHHASTPNSNAQTIAITRTVLVFKLAPISGATARCQRVGGGTGGASSATRRRARPVFSRQRTVPAGTPSACAISDAF